MNVIPKLLLNKHPKDSENLSLVTAQNIKVSNDESCITNEESIKVNTIIKNYLNVYYTNSGDGGNYNIISIIPCNNELAIIAVGSKNGNKAQIFRYREKDGEFNGDIKCVYGNTSNALAYHGGKIKGTFTYNVEGSLILAIAEYDGNGTDKIPLRTINLGNFDDNSIYNDSSLDDSKLAISPEVYLPKVNVINYVSGSAYKGWYYLFIRYKINSVDYTQWYSFGYPIYIDTIEQFQIIRYCYNRDHQMKNEGAWSIVAPRNSNDGYCVGCSDYFSNTSDIAKETFKINFYIRSNKYSKYQIGIVCASKSYTKAFRTADINFTNINSSTSEEYILNNKALIEYNVEDLITDNYNYFNIKNIINYKNRLYISNYEESNANDDSIVNSGILNNIVVRLNKFVINDKGLVYDYPIMNKDNVKVNQYDSYSRSRIPFSVFLNVTEDTEVTVNGTTGKASDFEIGVASNTLPEFIRIYKVTSPTATFSDNVTITTKKNGNVEATTLTMNTNDYAVNGSTIYYNPEKSFNERKINSTLIPGEVYNFFIHFVDKYGHATNGYRIENKTKWTTIDDSSTEIIPIPFKIDDNDYYAAAPIDSFVINDAGNINTAGMKFYKRVGGTVYNPKLEDNQGNMSTSFKKCYNSFANAKYANVKWYQIASTYNFTSWGLYINNNDDRLFRVPMINSSLNQQIVYVPTFENIQVPNEYEGFFISYEKYEPIRRVTGMLTRNDFRSQDYITSYNYRLLTVNCFKSSKMFFYTGDYDISDSIKLDYNLMLINGVNVWDKNDIPPYDNFQRNGFYTFVHNFNKPQVEKDTNILPAVYAIPNYKISVADSASDNRIGLGTALELEDSYNLFPSYSPSASENNKIRLYKVTLYNCTRDIYMSNNKTLIRLTDVYYKTSDGLVKYNTDTIRQGLNGHWSGEGVLVYENPGVSFNESDNIVRRVENNSKYYKTEVNKETPHTFQNDTPFASYVQYNVCSDIFTESKSFKNAPKGVVYFVKHDEGNSENNKFATGCMVTPANSIDLFENHQGSSDQFYPKSYTNYRKDLVSVDKFDKTVRRSNVIQDESRINGWRTFPVEGYKNITENKGNITNIVGIGTMLLVHTQHSLFMFDTNNTLETKDKSIQLSQPDAFEVSYKEVFTSDLGYGGLQNNNSFVVDQFGYIFYNDNFHRLYQFDNGQLATIDGDIIEWLESYKPNNVRFANDKFNNRLLIKMCYTVNDTDKEIVLSYNYNTKNFISLHTYTFEEAYNTKSRLYLQCDTDKHANCALHQFVRDRSSYGIYDNNIIASGEERYYESNIGIIINEQYNDIKYLDYISYKLNKIANPVNFDYTTSPVEGRIIPYSGDYLRVYNDQINTGVIDISIDSEEAKNVFGNYKKPYWEFGNWNFSYLRNNIQNYKNYGDAFSMSRLFGNFFVVQFTFSNKDYLEVEFEELNYGLSK
jgi:hypothetical protein